MMVTVMVIITVLGVLAKSGSNNGGDCSQVAGEKRKWTLFRKISKLKDMGGDGGVD